MSANQLRGGKKVEIWFNPKSKASGKDISRAIELAKQHEYRKESKEEVRTKTSREMMYVTLNSDDPDFQELWNKVRSIQYTELEFEGQDKLIEAICDVVIDFGGVHDIRIKILEPMDLFFGNSYFASIPKFREKVLKFCTPAELERVHRAVHQKNYSIFVLMPFKEEEVPQSLYLEYIKKPLEQKGFAVQRAGEFSGSKDILKNLFKEIADSEIIIAVLTKKNANVYYELGRAHEKKKFVIQLCHDIEKVKFDLNHFKTLFYNEERLENGSFVEELLKNIEAYDPIKHQQETSQSEYYPL